MRVLYDYQAFTFHKFGGIARYFCEIIRVLRRSETVELGFLFARNIYVPELGLKPCRLEQTVENFVNEQTFAKSVWLSSWIRFVWFVDRVFFAVRLAFGRYDLVHITYDIDTWAVRWLKKPFVYTVHDLIPELLTAAPSSDYLRKRQYLAQRAARIIAVSENTKRDLVRLWGVSPDKVDVVHHGVSVSDTGIRKWHAQAPYLLYVGGRGEYKNFAWLAQALSPLLKAHPSLKLVCTGEGFSRQELQELARLGIEKQCAAQFVDSAELFDLYRNAICFIFPSLYEGFGLPIIDAFHAGCPVVLPRASCFPEVAKEAAVFFSPGDAEACRRAVEAFVCDETLRRAYVERGFLRARDFSWEQTAQGTLAAYRRALSAEPSAALMPAGTSAENKLRIVHVNFDYGLAGLGGASIAASRLHNGLLAAGLDSWFVCNHQVAAGARVIEVPKRNTLSRPAFLYASKLLRNAWRLSPVRRAVPLNVVPSGMGRVINRLAPDVVHVQWVSPDVLSWGELRRIRAPLVVSLHDFWMLNGFSPYVGDPRAVTGYEAANSGWLERFLFRQKKKFFAGTHPVLVGPSHWVCQSAKESLIGRHLQCEAISNVLDTAAFRFRPDLRSAREKVVVLFGGFGGAGNPFKGFEDLMEALRRLPPELKSHVECHVFGEAAEDRMCDGVVVRYLGQVRSVEDMVRVYHSSDLLALPSKHETQGQTKMEALACGLPVVTFNRTACPEGLVHLQNGWIAPDGDIESFKNGIVWCIERLKADADGNSWRRQISLAAENEYGATCVVPQYVNLYRRAMKRTTD